MDKPIPPTPPTSSASEREEISSALLGISAVYLRGLSVEEAALAQSLSTEAMASRITRLASGAFGVGIRAYMDVLRGPRHLA